MIKTLQIPCTGYDVAADLYEGSKPDEILLSLHGWSADRKRYLSILDCVTASTGMSALAFDFSGHGDSPFKASDTRPAQHFLEVICVFDWIKSQFPDSRITVMGTSYGGYLATQLTKYRAFDKLILRAPAIYAPTDFYTLNGTINSDGNAEARDRFRKDVDALAKHPLLTRASSFKGKSLVIVHEYDELVPVQTTDAYIRAFNADVSVAAGLPHSLRNVPLDQIASYQNVIIDWLRA
jgi:pimeloyl-ACP methyl ester carboxylesterase